MVADRRATGTTPNGAPFGVNGIDSPFAGLPVGARRPRRARQPGHQLVVRRPRAACCRSTQFPQFDSWPSARWAKPGGPFDPHTGSQYVYSQIADVVYKRLTREIAVPAGGGDLTFWTSYDTEPDWDLLVVEARTAGGDDWTTLPDANGHTTQDTGRELPGRLARAAPAARPLPDADADDDCTPNGTTGAWNAASGSSSGWQQWRIDLTPTPARRSRSRSPTSATGPRRASACSSTTSPGRAGRRRSRPTSAAGRSRCAPGQRPQRQQLDHRRRRVPGRCLDHDAEVAPDRLRVRGHRDAGRAQRGDGPRDGSPARLTRPAGSAARRAASAARRVPA